MSDPERKVVAFPISLGTVRLTFVKEENDWVCKLASEFMTDLQDALDGKIPRERVRWVDIPELGDNDGSSLS